MTDKLLEELFELLDNNEDIKRINDLKSKINDDIIDLIQDYRNNPTIENKRKLYDNKIINEYLICENNINYLIMQINSKFKRRKTCESNKW